MEPTTAIGKVVKTHGVRGGLKVLQLSDFPQRIHQLNRVFLEKGSTRSASHIRNAAENGRYWTVYLEGIETRDQAQALVGTLLTIPNGERWELPPDVYYIDDLIGLEVFTLSGQLLGTVSDVLKPGSNDVYVINSADSRQEILIPALKAVVKSIDLIERRIVVDPPEGLL